MSDFDPGAGWRAWQPGTLLPEEHVVYRRAGFPDRFWVRDVPVPPLPTEPGWYANTKHFGALYLRKDGYWLTASGSTVRPENIHDRNLVLMEPRAVTARAVLDRINQEYPPGSFMDLTGLQSIAREFGGDS